MRWFIGDVHACFQELEQMLSLIYKQDSSAQVICVGDLINKGPSTPKTLDLVIRHKIQCIVGNHELWFLRIMNTPQEKWLPRDQKLIQQFDGLAQSYRALIQSWPPFLEFEEVIAVHGGIIPGTTDLSTMDPWISSRIRTWDGIGKDLNNNSNPAWFDLVQLKKPIVFGHWAQKGLVNLPHAKGLDTGCVYGKQLTAWCSTNDTFLHIQAKECYQSI